MSTTAIVLAALAAASFPLLLWAIGRGVSAAGARVPADPAADRQYLAGRVHGARIADLLACGDELLVSLAAPAGGGQLARVYLVTGDAYCRARAERWRREGTPLRVYLSADGAVQLVDPVLGGNVACEPAAAA